MMDPERAKRFERWFASQFKSTPGGFEGACDMPDSPVKASKLSEASRGLARLSLADALYLCSVTGRSDLLRTLADKVDGGETPDQCLAYLARTAMFKAVHLCEHIELAKSDGVYSAAELYAAQEKSAASLSAMSAVHDAALRLKPGPVHLSVVGAAE